MQLDTVKIGSPQPAGDRQPLSVSLFIGTLNIGGAERQFLQLAQSLSKRGHDVQLVLLYPGGVIWDSLQVSGDLRPIVLCSKKSRHAVLNALKVILSISRLRAFIRQSKSEIVYSGSPMANIIAWLAVRSLKNVKLVWGVRSSQEHSHWKQRVSVFWGTLVARTVPLTIANSRAGLALYKQKKYISSNAVVIPNGIDTDLYRNDSKLRNTLRRSWSISEEEILVGLVGRIDPVKGHATFIHAAARLSKDFPRLRFVCVGNGDTTLKRELKQLALSLDLGDQLTWAGDIADMPAVYNALDVLCSASLSEGFSNVIAEAMACGLRCVVTDVGDSSFLVDGTGIVVPANDVNSLAEGIGKVLGKDSAVAGDASRQRIVKHFSADKAAQATIDSLEQLLR